MLSDRSYMRSDYPRESTSMLTWLLCAVIAGGIVQLACERLLGTNILATVFGLSRYSLASAKIWSVWTYAFLHDGSMHLGARRFLALFSAAVITGGLFWLGVHALIGGGTILLGASAAITAMFIVFACIYPEREITFLLFFVLPVTLRPKILAWILIGVDALGFLFSEIPGGSFDSGVAHSAHLGGVLAGWIFYRYFHANNGWDRASSPIIALPVWLKRRQAGKAPAAAKFHVNIGGDANLRAEVDRILDKINSEGFGALTDQEKKTLDDAKDLLSRR